MGHGARVGTVRLETQRPICGTSNKVSVTEKQVKDELLRFPQQRKIHQNPLVGQLILVEAPQKVD